MLLDGQNSGRAGRQKAADNRLEHSEVLRRDHAFCMQAICGRRILVTGGGGAVGSALVRQIARLAPENLVVTDISDGNLGRIWKWLDRNNLRSVSSAYLGDVRDEAAISRLVETERPELVFHAAALTSPLLTDGPNVLETVRTNVLGSRIVLDAAIAVGADFVSTSSGEALASRDVGALTTRVAELLVRERAAAHPALKLRVARFKNLSKEAEWAAAKVKEQIEAGGPVAIAHDSTRPPLSTFEHVATLLLRVASLPRQGYVVYRLDTGHVRPTFDVAVEMIKRAGRRPFIDIDLRTVTSTWAGEIRGADSPASEVNIATEARHVHAIASDPDLVASAKVLSELLQATESRATDAVKDLIEKFASGPVGPEPAVVSGAISSSHRGAHATGSNVSPEVGIGTKSGVGRNRAQLNGGWT